MKFFPLREEDRNYLQSLFYATGVILFWRAIWETSAVMPLLHNPFFTLFVGLAMITITGYISHEFDPLSKKMHSIGKQLNNAVNLSERGDVHTVHYHDKTHNKERIIDARKIKRVEHDMVVYIDAGKEHFVPTNRIVKISKKDDVVWRR